MLALAKLHRWLSVQILASKLPLQPKVSLALLMLERLIS